MASKIREAFFSDKGLQGQIHKLVNPRDKLFEIDSVKKVCSSNHSSSRAAAVWLSITGLDHRGMQSGTACSRPETGQLHVFVLRARPYTPTMGMVWWVHAAAVLMAATQQTVGHCMWPSWFATSSLH